jgi:hypothetical protein
VLDALPFTFSMKPKRMEVREQILAILEGEGATSSQDDAPIQT